MFRSQKEVTGVMVLLEYKGFVIFVKNGKVGDKVKVKVTSVGNRFAIAEIV
jgi:predicted RNA-binding protein with TRAM domain